MMRDTSLLLAHHHSGVVVGTRVEGQSDLTLGEALSLGWREFFWRLVLRRLAGDGGLRVRHHPSTSPSHDQRGMCRPSGTSSADRWYRAIVVAVIQAK
jgi:hypothetical protein